MGGEATGVSVGIKATNRSSSLAFIYIDGDNKSQRDVVVIKSHRAFRRVPKSVALCSVSSILIQKLMLEGTQGSVASRCIWLPGTPGMLDLHLKRGEPMRLVSHLGLSSPFSLLRSLYLFPLIFKNMSYLL